MTAVIAQQSATCRTCSLLIYPGDRVVLIDDQMTHEACDLAEMTIAAMVETHQTGWVTGIVDVLNALENVQPMLGPDTGYAGPMPDELCEWVSDMRDRIAVMREHVE